ncbi:MAG: serine/threonine protein kinase [Phycisphaerales bacterium]|nr:serine/threonine protein kinase [Phycisphaerales bacterium]
MNYETVKEVFEKAIGIPKEEREQFAIEHSESEDILEEVLSLLACSLPEDVTDFSYEPMIGKTVGPFQITKRIGSGGMGRVYEAKNEKTGKSVAIKIMRKQFLGGTAGKRFEQEVRVLGSLNVRGVAKIESTGTVEIEGVKLPWVAMELLDGSVSITEFAKNKTTDEQLELLCKICKIVDDAHRHGVIHRDLKPNNILVNNSGDPTLIDFGIAKVLDDELRATGLHTQASGFLGTPQYMAPEQFSQGESETTATDVFSLGVIMFEVLTGEHPFATGEKSLPATILAITQGEPTKIESIDRRFRGDISLVVHKAISQDSRRRYASAGELGTDLLHIIDGEPVSAKPEPLLTKLVRKHRFAAALFAITIPLLAIATTVSVNYAIDANRQLVRNEKLLEFANKNVHLPRPLIEQHEEYWRTFVDRASAQAIQIAGDDSVLYADLLSMLGGKDEFTLVEKDLSEVYLRASAVLKKQNNGDTPKSLLLEAKSWNLNFSPVLLQSIVALQAIDRRWVFGETIEYAELLSLLARAELDAGEEEFREKGFAHPEKALVVTRQTNQKQRSQQLTLLKAWALVNNEEDKASLSYAIQLLKTQLREELQVTEHLNAIKLLSIAHFKRSKIQSKVEELQDIELAIDYGEEATKEIISSFGNGLNIAWQSMNNLAIIYVAKANWLLQHDPNRKDDIECLQLNAAILWRKVLHQSHYRDPDHDSNKEYYLPVFQEHLPEDAPSDEEWEQFLRSSNSISPI